MHAFSFTSGERARGGLAPRTNPNGSEKRKISVGNRTTIPRLSIRSLATKRSRLLSPAITQNCIDLLKVTYQTKNMYMTHTIYLDKSMINII